MKPQFLIALLAGTVPAPLFAQLPPEPPNQPAPAEPAPAPDSADAAPRAAEDAPEDPLVDDPLDDDLLDEEEGEQIVVTGQPLRGAVIGGTDPEIQLDRRDIRATGAGSVAELLDAIAPQTRSARGRGGDRPVVLLNGRRISGFSEIRDLPPEAIDRVDILPEEVALRYGYRADQRVVNIVLRRRFRATTAELEGGLATAGGRGSYEADLNHLRIDRAGRWSVDFEYRHSDPLFESERDIVQAPGAPEDIGRFRTLLPETDQLSLNGTLHRSIFGDVSATANGRLDLDSSIRFLGLGAGERPLTRESDGRTAHIGLALNGDILPWRWSLTANYDNVRSTSRSDTGVEGADDRARSTSSVGNADFLANGRLFDLPAGPLSASFRLGFDTRDFGSTTLRGGIEQSRELSRDRGSAQANLDLPIASRRRGVLSAVGDLSANFNAEVERLSDFGTLRTIGYGISWSPIGELDLGASVTDEEGAPSMQQLGDPLLMTPNVRVFDFVRGETVDIGRLEGGNPNLLADRRRVLSLRASARPLSDEDLSVIVNYSVSRIERPIASFPTATPEIEAAFPERFLRGADGRLLRIDARPVNFARSERRELRWGVNFSEPIGPQGRPGGPGGWRQRAGRGDRAQTQGQPGEPAQTAQPGRTAEPRRRPRDQAGERPGGGGGPGGRGPGGFGGRGFGGGGFGGRGGRLQLALFHTWHLENEILIREGVPALDLLGGSAIGSRGGQPRHEVEAQAGIFKDGLGARLTANWQSGTFVRGAPDPAGGTSGDLFFSDLATVNLRLFADLGLQRSLVRESRLFRGMRVSLSIDNLFDSRLRVRDETGATPRGYQPDYLDPLGRSVRLTIRKLFF